MANFVILTRVRRVVNLEFVNQRGIVNVERKSVNMVNSKVIPKVKKPVREDAVNILNADVEEREV
tara:strand:+ start:6391 stop:6585 length:195 start_codon:yes stop_codon:yes gene_type:complete